MKKLSHSIMYVLAIAVLGNWGAEETSQDGRKKNKINIRGTLETYQLDENEKYRMYDVDNISVDKIYEKIPMYNVPSPTDYDPETRRLKLDPTKKFTRFPVDLVTGDGTWKTVEIRIDDRKATWKYYSSPSALNPTEYIEVTVISNNDDQTEKHYIIDAKKRLHFDDLAGDQENIDTPIDTIKKLTIEGFTHRDLAKAAAQEAESRTLLAGSKDKNAPRVKKVESTDPQTVAATKK